MNFFDLDRITIDPQMKPGKPCILGIRITVGTITGLLASGETIDRLLEPYLSLERDDIYAVLAYATCRAKEYDVPLKASRRSSWTRIFQKYGKRSLTKPATRESTGAGSETSAPLIRKSWRERTRISMSYSPTIWILEPCFLPPTPRLLAWFNFRQSISSPRSSATFYWKRSARAQMRLRPAPWLQSIRGVIGFDCCH